MAQFDKSVSIVVDPHSPENIANALAEYRQRISDGSAFRLSMNLLLNVLFVKPDGSALTLDDAGSNRPLVEQAINACRFDEKQSYITEPVLFGAALNFPELMPAVVETIEALVAFSRSRNDSNDLWLDDYNAFAVEALYMLIAIDSRYSWMLAHFLVPYWDTQTMTAPLCLLSGLVGKHGWTQELIKAYVWCDGAEVRRYFYEDINYDAVQADLLSHLQSQPEDYAYFKSELVERLQSTPILQTADEPYSLAQMLFEYYDSMGAWPVGSERWQLEEQPELSQEEWQDKVKQQLICGAKVEDEIIALAATLTETRNESEYFSVAEAQRNGLDNAYQAWMEPAAAEEESDAEPQSELEPELDQEPEVEPIQWDEATGRKIFTCLNPRTDLITQSRLERLNDELGYRDGQEIIEALPYMPLHLGSSTYLALRLNQEPSSDECAAISQWLEQHLSQLLSDFVLKFCKVTDDDSEALRQWLCGLEPDIEQVAAADIDAKMIELVRAGMAKDGGKSGPEISAKQAAYWTLFTHDAGQRCMLTILLLQSASRLTQCRSSERLTSSSPVIQLAKRHWQLWLAIAPQRAINRIVKFKADYPLYAAIDAQDTEAALFDLVQQHGVSEAMLEAFTLMTDQQVADYRPADPRFARRYADKVAQYAALDSADTSMIGRQQLLQFEALLQQLEYCREDQVLAFFQHLKAVNPSVVLPIMPMFEAALLNTLKEDFDDASAQTVSDKLMAYLGSGEGLQELSPQALKLPKLQGWNPYPMYRGKVGPADFVWLLPSDMAGRLTLFLAQLGKRGLHWLGRCSVEEAYVASRIQSGKITMAERWSHGEVGNERHRDSDIGDALDVAKQGWALNWLDKAGVPEAALVYFAVHEGYEQQEFVRRLAAENRLPDMQDWLTANERVQLLEMLQGAESLTDATAQSFLQDCSSAVKQLANKLFGNRS
ncbi:hypothetical protein L2719_12830 [Shewanella schlegeliana]|uniref:Uncharacterized protein n=1 Tax=Shewanella schlegeliana TaxID=190308 RepID=A0ABS1T245_9GAMM|nr:hypothetical protein [Shewanella schlegeliana]MBL4914878.1 hypothetical protein [Shewanella schlegeliana]MCL1110431.1 hypothetical protein [Shewanella schlegeliana]GIU27696.1 hypothetical protein TUM4433_15000 [Shewanella schlegeliana]